MKNIEKPNYNKELKKEEVDIDEAKKPLKPSYWKAEWRLGTQSEVDKNNKKIYDKLAKTDPDKAKKFHDNLMKIRKEEVLGRIGGAENIRPFDQRPRRVGFAARFDQEKQPGFFMDLIEMYGELTTEPCEFAIYSGGPLRSNNQEYVERARQMEAEGKLKIYDNISKNEYYAHLNNTRVLFNCALQDWVSNTVSEADTLGCNVLYPAYRSFPETFANDPNRLYVPWSIDDAYHKMQNLLRDPHHNMGLISDWNNGTIDRVIDIMQGQGEQWNRAGNRYRDHTAHEKYQVIKIEE